MPFMTPNVKVRMSLVPGFNHDAQSVQWSFSIWVWFCPLAIRGKVCSILSLHSDPAELTGEYSAM